MSDSDNSSKRSGGIDFEGDVDVSGDVAGRDVHKSVTVGFSEKAVQRLVITVAVIVFVTAACFFTGGVALGAGLSALNRQVNSSEQAAISFAEKLQDAESVAAGETQPFVFSEDELSSYVRFIAGPQIGLSEGKARIVEPDLIAVGGRLAGLANLNVAATYRIQEHAENAFQLESAAVQLVPIEGSSFGWVAVPNALLQQYTRPVEERLGDYIVTDIRAIGGDGGGGLALQVTAP
jgi:hypothetical protein